MTGPLSGTRIIELGGIGPAPFAAMMLADHGAEIVRIERDGAPAIPHDPVMRGRRSLALDLRRPAARDAFLRLVEAADGLIDPFRPGRLEALDLGPDVLHEHNPRLVIARLTGWGQSGPLSQRAGHDIDYLALSGMLSLVGPAHDRPSVPANLVADYGAGAMMCAFAMAAALREVAAGAGEGRVIDVAMSECAATLGTFLYGMRNAGMWRDGRESNLLDGGAGFYGTYQCADGRYLAVGALEPPFLRAFLQGVGLEGHNAFADPLDPGCWSEQRDLVAERIASQPLAGWLALFEGKDACVAPVLRMDEAPKHEHFVDRGVFVETARGPVPAPAPRYGTDPLPHAMADPDGTMLLTELGYDAEQIRTIVSKDE